jgi:predicted signal transduction protein with EAL and GGDEF domain
VEQVQSLARRLAERIAQPIEFENTMVHITASMGIAVFPDHGAGLDELLRHADMALYAAKAGGRQNHALFVPSMGAAFSERIFLQHALARALGTDELSLVYQPLINLQTGALTGFEALLRWRHPERGMVPPLVFIPVAEKCGLIDALGDEVVQRVCRQLGRWQFAGLPLLPVAINVSALHFERGNLGPQMVAAARAAHIDPALLQLEITESALMNSSAQGARNLAELKAAGIKVTIDDFGIGYSSLNQLKSFAIDGLKIDRSFVRDMTTDTRDASIVSAIIGIARSLGISVLAEGVESMQHVQQLRALGCEHGQGNYLFEPASVENCATLLARHARGEAVFRQLLRLQAVSV